MDLTDCNRRDREKQFLASWTIFDNAQTSSVPDFLSVKEYPE
jgi:hypothetical protein